MVITQNIESAIRYYQSIQKILDGKGRPFKVAIAFSGKKKVDGIEHTEASLNGFPDKDTKDKFDEDAYRILVVANKYLTGFDQPKLCTMYVDKKLQGVLAVQALSRLNRSATKYGKRSEDLFVLDFFNEVEDIKKAFDPYYTVTSLERATDVNVLHELKGSLDDVGVYEWAEVESFAEQYFNNVEAGELSPLIQFAAERFNATLQLEDDEKADFKIKAKQFVKIYSQLSSILPYEVLDWEKLFWFLKFLIPELQVRTKTDDAIDELLESVDLSTYGLERTRLNHAIGLDDTETELDPQNPNPRGAHNQEEEKDPLDEIIRAFNDRFYTGWEETPEEARVKFVALAKNIRNHPDFESKVANNTDTQNSDLALKKILDDLMLQRRKANLEEYKRYRQDEAYYQGMFDLVKRLVGRL
jgi:type I restriction enzyme R subunit